MMKTHLTLILLVLGSLSAAGEDMLRLRDGRVFAGEFLGASRTEL